MTSLLKKLLADCPKTGLLAARVISTLNDVHWATNVMNSVLYLKKMDTVPNRFEQLVIFTVNPNSNYPNIKP